MQKRIGFIFALVTALTLFLCGCVGARTKTLSKTAVAMGSAVTVKLICEDDAQIQEAADAVIESVQTLDGAVISKNAPSAELYRLNARENPETKTPVSDELYDALQRTKAIYAHSAGKAALASGALTTLWGIDTEAFRVPSKEEIEAAKALCGDKTVELSEKGFVSFQKGQILNLGSVGKGLACDKGVQTLKNAYFGKGVTGAVISVGGSVATLGSPETGERWTVGIRDPYGTTNAYFATLRVGETFLSTSGTYEKQFTENGKTYHHLLDLTTGYPAESTLCSVTVCAAGGLESDALSTLCFLVGEERAREVLELYNAEAVFVYTDKTVHVTAGLGDALTVTDTAYRLEAV